MEDLITWVWHNKEWLFSGLGLAIIGWMGFMFKNSTASSRQTIRSGNRSTNIQACRDISIVTKKKENDVEIG